jgi:hypothetical protein
MARRLNPDLFPVSRARPALTAAAVALAAAALAACAGPPDQPEQPEPRPLVGCHYFVQDQVAQQLRLPWGLRLLDRPLEDWPAIQQRGDVRVATTLTGQGEASFPFGYWLRTAEDSVEMGYPGGGGLVLRLAMENGALRGTAHAVGDALQPPAARPSPAAHPVALTWARCPDE